MKQITSKTILKQRGKEFQPVEVDGVIYWVDKKQNLYNRVVHYWYDSLISNKRNFKKAIVSSSNDYIVKEGRESFIGFVVAQSQPKIKEIPVINLDSYVETLAQKEVAKRNMDENDIPFAECWYEIGYKSNPNQYTKEDIKKTIELVKKTTFIDADEDDNRHFLIEALDEEILEQINSISLIEVDEQFNILSYE
jgi:hypothetical protein